MTHTKSYTNQYQQAIPSILFEQIPKSVWAAIAISALTSGGDRLEDATSSVVYEWIALHQNGIVPQMPSRRVRELAND